VRERETDNVNYESSDKAFVANMALSRESTISMTFVVTRVVTRFDKLHN